MQHRHENIYTVLYKCMQELKTQNRTSFQPRRQTFGSAKSEFIHLLLLRMFPTRHKRNHLKRTCHHYPPPGNNPSWEGSLMALQVQEVQCVV